jgi:hypothetical protein
MDSLNLLDRVLGRPRGAPALGAPPNVTRRFAVSIAQGATEELPRPAGRMVLHCRTGALWITHDGDPRDVILGENQSYLVDREDRMTVHGLRAGGLEIEVMAA